MAETLTLREMLLDGWTIVILLMIACILIAVYRSYQRDVRRQQETEAMDAHVQKRLDTYARRDEAPLPRQFRRPSCVRRNGRRQPAEPNSDEWEAARRTWEGR